MAPDAVAVSGELAGALDQRVMIERRDPVRDALGGAGGGWTAIASVWAAIAAEGNGPFIVGEARSALPRWRVTLRAGADVRVGDRIVWQGRSLKVRAVREEVATWQLATAEER